MRNVICRLLGLAALLPACAAAQDAAAGREIARRWCSSCHVVERAGAAAPANGLPTFPAIAARADMTEDRLRAAVAHATVTGESLADEIARLIGTPWDDELEAYRCAHEGSTVRVLHQVV